LQTDTIDFHLFHHLTQQRWQELQQLDAIQWAENATADGRIGHLGFSFHDSFDAFREIVDGYNN